MKTLTILVISILLSTPVWADVSLKDKAACFPDAFKYCHHLKNQKNDPSFAQQIISCLQAERANLKPACRAVFIKNGM